MLQKMPLMMLLAVSLLLPAAADADGQRYRLEVDGLACPFCAYGIEKELNALEGVEQVATEIADSAVIVTVEEDRELEEATAAQAVADAGFTLRSFARMSPQSEQTDSTED